MPDLDLDPRLHVKESVLSCERCPRFASCSGPVPFSGPTPASVVVVGDNPAVPDDDEGKPFVGPAGQLLRLHLDSAGIDTGTVGFMNTISCYTPKTPTADEVSACAPNRLAQLDVFDPQWVLLCGATALKAIRPELEIGHARGAPFTAPGYPGITFFPVYHPSFAMHQKIAENQFAADLKVFAAMIDGADPMPYVADSCGRCGLEAFYWEENLLAWGNCGQARCGIPEPVKIRLAAILAETDGLGCRSSGCATPASGHPLSFPTGTAPDQMSWNALSSEEQKLMRMVSTGVDKGVSVDVLMSHSKQNKVTVEGWLDRLKVQGWVLSPAEERADTWVMSPRAKRLMK